MSNIKQISHWGLSGNEQKAIDTQSKYSQMDDVLLWEKFKEGDESAFVHIYTVYFEELSHFGVQYTQLHVVEDCIQDLFVDLRRKRTKLPVIRSSIRSFLFQSIKRRILTFLKRNKIEYNCGTPKDQFEIIQSHESILILNQQQKEMLHKLDSAISELSERQREIVYYFFYKGMGYEELRGLLAFRDVKSARNIVYKIISKLKKAFDG